MGTLVIYKDKKTFDRQYLSNVFYLYNMNFVVCKAHLKFSIISH